LSRRNTLPLSLRFTARAALMAALAVAASCAPETPATAPDGLRPARDVAPSSLVGTIFINEVESNQGTPGDWIELYNAGSEAVDLSGFYIRDDNNSRTDRLPAGSVIPAGGYLVLDEENQFAFGLGAADQARLFAPDGTTVIDQYSWPAHAATTYARCPDGSSNWATATLSTKGAANDCSVRVVINEVESSGDDAGDWIELYNPSLTTVDVGGFVLSDNNDAQRYVIPAGTLIPAQGHVVFLESTLGFGLGSADAARLFRPDGVTLADSYTWTTHATTTYGRCPDGSGAFVTTVASTRGAINNCGAPTTAVKVNEVESNADAVGDWVEFFNTSAQPVDLSGYVFRDNDNTRGYTLPAGSIVPANGYLVLLESQFGFGLGGADEARLFAPGGVTLVDSYAWSTHAGITYGRCPDGTGAFASTTVSTRGTANVCGTPVSFLAWPGSASVSTVDAANTFGSNMSGLSYQTVAGVPSGVVWAVKNGPGTLYRLTNVNGTWTPRASRLWSNGKALRYPDGTGDVDAEGVVARGSAIYVSAERNNSVSNVSRLSILRYNVAVENGATLLATHEWNLTGALPAVGANLGLEGIAFVPDDFLVARGFTDESKGRAYAPADYPNHEGGLFFVAVEGTGMVHAFALDHVSGGFTRVASFAGGFPGAMDLSFDAELGQLWVICDDTCQGRSAVHRIDTQAGSLTRGQFVVREHFERPAGLPNTNNEGFTFAPLSACVNGVRPALWADDNQLSGFALRQGTVACSPF
jgi:hypothetical protein